MDEDLPINQTQSDDTTQNVVPDLNDLLSQQTTDLENIPSTNTNPPDNNNNLINQALISETSKTTGIPDYTKANGPAPIQPDYDTKQGNVPYDTLYGEPTNQLIDDSQPVQDVETPDTSYEQEDKQEEPKNPYEITPNNKVQLINPITGATPINQTTNDKKIPDNAKPARDFWFGGITDAIIHGEKFDEEHLSKASYVESAIAGLVDGTIRTFPSVAYAGAEILDYFGEKGIPLEQSHVARLTDWINSKPVLSQIMHAADLADIAARQTAVGEIAKGIGEFITSAALVEGAVGLGAIGLEAAGLEVAGLGATALAGKLVDAAYSGRLVTAEGAALEGQALTNALNKKAGLQKYTSILIKGGVTGALDGSLVANVEDIGTFGSYFGAPTALDNQPRKFADEEAGRYFMNRLKFMGEGGLLGGLIPIAFTRVFKGGVEEVGAKAIAQEKVIEALNKIGEAKDGTFIPEAAVEQGQKLAENNNKLGEFIERNKSNDDEVFENAIEGC